MGVVEILNKQAYEEGFALGMEESREELREARAVVKNAIVSMRKNGFSLETIANLMAISEQKVINFFHEIDTESEELN